VKCDYCTARNNQPAV